MYNWWSEDLRAWRRLDVEYAFEREPDGLAMEIENESVWSQRDN